jgi:hypothetical protein
MKVVTWAELSPHLQIIPMLYQQVNEGRQEPLPSTDFYRGLVLNFGYGLLISLRKSKCFAQEEADLLLCASRGLLWFS